MVLHILQKQDKFSSSFFEQSDVFFFLDINEADLNKGHMKLPKCLPFPPSLFMLVLKVTKLMKNGQIHPDYLHMWSH